MSGIYDLACQRGHEARHSALWLAMNLSPGPSDQRARMSRHFTQTMCKTLAARFWWADLFCTDSRQKAKTRSHSERTLRSQLHSFF